MLYLACTSAHLWSLGQEGGGYLASPLHDTTLAGNWLTGCWRAGRLTVLQRCRDEQTRQTDRCLSQVFRYFARVSPPTTKYICT